MYSNWLRVEVGEGIRLIHLNKGRKGRLGKGQPLVFGDTHLKHPLFRQGFEQAFDNGRASDVVLLGDVGRAVPFAPRPDETHLEHIDHVHMTPQ